MKSIFVANSVLAMLISVSAAFAQSTQTRGVVLPAAPKGGAESISAGATRFLETGAAKLEIKEPLRIYSGGPIESLAEGKLDATETNEYFYGVFVANKPMGWARLQVNASGAGRLLSVTSNAPDAAGNAPVLPLASSVDLALKQLATNAQMLSSSYEARLLSIIGTTGGGPFYVLWLKPSAGDDWVFTLDQRFKPAGVDTKRLYSTAEFMKLIQPVARLRMEQLQQQPANTGRALPGA